MARYIEDDSESGHTLLITAGVVAGLIAGAVVAQRLGGWRGIRRLLKGRRAPLLKVIRAAIPSGTVGSVLDVVGIDRIVSALLGSATAGVRSEFDERVQERLDRRARRAAGRRRPDPDLDEYEVDDFERAAAGMDDEDEVEVEEGLTPEAIEAEVLAAFRRHPVLRQRALEIAVDDDGTLELTGWVRAERELRIARRVAARVEGVEHVVVDVAVRDRARTPARAGVAAADDADDDDVAADAPDSP